MENQQERMDKHMKQLTETHRQKIAMLESQFLQQKQQLLRGMITTVNSEIFARLLFCEVSISELLEFLNS